MKENGGPRPGQEDPRPSGSEEPPLHHPGLDQKVRYFTRGDGYDRSLARQGSKAVGAPPAPPRDESPGRTHFWSGEAVTHRSSLLFY